MSPSWCQFHQYFLGNENVHKRDISGDAGLHIAIFEINENISLEDGFWKVDGTNAHSFINNKENISLNCKPPVIFAIFEINKELVKLAPGRFKVSDTFLKIMK